MPDFRHAPARCADACLRSRRLMIAMPAYRRLVSSMLPTIRSPRRSSRYARRRLLDAALRLADIFARCRHLRRCFFCRRRLMPSLMPLTAVAGRADELFFAICYHAAFAAPRLRSSLFLFEFEFICFTFASLLMMRF